MWCGSCSNAGAVVMKVADTDSSGELDKTEMVTWLRKQEASGGPKVSSFVPKLIARIKEEKELA